MLLAVLALSLVLRLIRIDQSFWLDEAINVNVIKSLDIQTLVTQYSLGDFHPPLYHVILKFWYLLWTGLGLPVAEVTFRLPSVIFGVLTVYFVYLLGKRLFDKKTALVAALLLATSPLHIYYSQEARMYALACFLSLLSAYTFVSIIKKDKLIYWFGFITSTSAMLYSDYLPYMMIPVYLAYILVRKKTIPKGTFTAFIPAFLVIGISLVPWLVLLPSQLSTGLSAAAASPAWAQVVGSPSLNSLLITPVKFIIGRISIENNFIYILTLIPVLLFVKFVFFLSLLRSNKNRMILYFWYFIPIFGSFLFASVIPIFAYFRLLYVLPAFYLILAAGIYVIHHKGFNRSLLAGLLVINLLSLSAYFIYPRFQRENWKGATDFIKSEGNPKSAVVLFESNYTMAPFDYYNNGALDAYGGLDSFDASTSDIKSKVVRFTEGKQRVYLFQYLSGITDPQGLLFKEISLHGYENIQTKDFNGVGFVYIFEK